MRQALFAVLMTVAVVGSIVEYSLAQSLPTQEDLKNFKDIKPKKDTTLKERIRDGKRPHKTEKDSQAINHYKCLDHCALTRQSCEAFVSVHPDSRKSIIGLKENYEWSRKCYNLYSDCQDNCSVKQNVVHWKRLKTIKEKGKDDKKAKETP